ncbi:LmbE family N-acetylglucosaminyl deacetylase [Sphingomonas prati]|uniref:LmbE family N-acetylglucosaminyl deacetylase n=1 Tax=Sphingomonas prati TaxID=1843237 RepID=A0A7W9BS59_9SPHN|nr:PIG-L family deacetylase [Sphingomonas prati]MBB5729141.1 LmbE family N-acetylglucosaminyl deacetylase [Sphingomonas prati]
MDRAGLLGQRSVVVAPGQRTWARLVRRGRGLDVRALAALGPWLVLAPHPDDEALGAGGMLARLAAAGADPRMAILTDGAASHVGAPRWGPRRLAGVRRQEAGHAVRALSVRPAVHLGWRDAAPPVVGDKVFRAGVRRLSALIVRHRVRALAVCWSGEAHCDHEAAAALARAVVTAARGRVRLYEYLVWGWTDPALGAKLNGRRVVSVDVAAARRAHRRSIDCHRSQTGTRVQGAVDPFRLPRAMIALTARPRTVLLEGAGHAA